MKRARPTPLLCALLAACATSGGASKGPPTLHHQAKGPAARDYETQPPSGEGLRGPHAVRVGRGITRGATARGRALTPDPRLAELAAWVADALDENGAPPPYPVIDFFAHHLGLVEPTPTLLVLRQTAGALESTIADDIAGLLPSQRYTHVGAVTKDEAGAALAVVALSWRWAELAPLPREVRDGDAPALTGKLTEGLESPQLVVSFPDGQSQRVALGKGPAFSSAIPTRGRGEHRIELLANSELGITVVANFPLYVGMAAPTSITLQGEAEGDLDLAPAEVERRLLSLINRDRAHAGLAPVTTDARLARVALAHSHDMLEHGFVGHTSKATGSAADRVRSAGIRSGIVLENIGRNYSPEEVHRGLMDSPGHRANVLSPDATHVGFGVVTEREDGRPAYLVTELFVRLAGKIDVGDAPEALLDAINRERSQRGRKELASDDALSALCAQEASSYFASPQAGSDQVRVERLSKQASTKHLRYTRLSTLLTVVSSLEEASRIDSLLDARAKGIGLGVAQGTRPDTIEDAIVVVALIGY